jgi:hypothetical protein
MVMVIVVVVMAEYHDMQDIRKRRREDKAERQGRRRDGAHLDGISWWGEYDLTQIPT